MFRFKGISSSEMGVIVEEEEHFIAKAEQRYNEVQIDGRDGSDYNTLGYSDVERPIKVQVVNIEKIDDILAWLDGEGEFEYKGRKTIARFYGELEPIRSASIRIIDTTFIRAPFWNKVEDEFIIVTNSVTNEGNKQSRPIIRLEKNTDDEIDITIGDVRFKYTFNNETYVEIDCKDKNALYQGLNRNRQLEIGYKYPKLEVGINQITVNEGDSTIKIKRKDRWL